MKCPKDNSHELLSQVNSDLLHVESMSCPICLEDYLVVYPPADVGVIYCTPENERFLLVPFVARASLSLVDLNLVLE